MSKAAKAADTMHITRKKDAADSGGIGQDRQMRRFQSSRCARPIRAMKATVAQIRSGNRRV